MQTLMQDLRYGARMLFKQPGFTLIAVVTLALGIGANTAIFSVVNGVLLRALPFADPARLLMLYEKKEGQSYDTVSYQDFNDFRAQTQSFERLAAVSPVWTLNLTGTAEAQQVQGYFVSGDLFATLGAQALRGRLIGAAEDQPNNERVAVLSYAAWQQRFGGDPQLIGRSLTLDAQPVTVIGVLPPGSRVLEDVDVYLPLVFNPMINRGRHLRMLSVIARLQADTSLTAAQAELNGVMANLARQYPDTNTGFRAELAPLHEHVTGKIRGTLWMLLGTVAFVLLIACANVAGLSLARATARSGELAVRAALGASRWRMVRLLLTESVLLAVLGSAAGLLLASWGLDVLPSLSPGNIPRLAEISIDRTVLAFTSGLALLTGIAFGVAPAWQLTRVDLHAALKDSGRGAVASGGLQRMRNALVVAEIALALVLLVGAGLLVRSMQRLLEVQPGFATENLISFSVALTGTNYSDPQRRADFYLRLEERLQTLPGVRAVGATTRLPLLTSANNVTTAMVIEGRPETAQDRVEVDFRRSTPGYFAAMGIPLLRGRFFHLDDLRAQNSVVVINEKLAQRYWPNEDAVGKRIQFVGGPNAAWSTIVGVIGNVRHLGLDVEPRPEVYLHYLTSPPTGPVITLSAAGAPDALVAAVRNEIRALDPNVPVSALNTMQQVIARSVAPRRFNLSLFGAFAVVALLLALAGIYSVMSYTVAQRTHEIGLRMALGANARDVLRLVIGQGMKLALAGVLLGLAGAFALTRLMKTLLFGVSPTDPLTFTGIACLLAFVSLVACWVPARRATKVDPLIALRCD
jgi:putative ABC transport system permease protein